MQDKTYEFKPVLETDLPVDINSDNSFLLENIMKDKFGEVYIAQNSMEFLSILKKITTTEFKKFHREDAVFFLGVKEWDILSLYYPHIVEKYGYILRNMLVISNENSNNWYPIFMFTRISYRFYLDRIRIEIKTKEKRKWLEEEFIGLKVKNISGKEITEGNITEILEKYSDNFPKLVAVDWKDKITVEFVMHFEEEEFIAGKLKFYCPKCYSELKEPYDPIEDNFCTVCREKLWISLETIPIIKEHQEISQIFDKLENNKYLINQVLKNRKIKKENNLTLSKFSSLERINWGASPGARKIMLGEYFTKMRLYRIEQPIVAQYLTILRKSKNMSVKDIINKLPTYYYHTVGHWFRKDFGGSIPIPQDIELIEEIFNIENSNLFKILKRTALKLQTVKMSVKGKNPGDYIQNQNEEELIKFLQSTYKPFL